MAMILETTTRNSGLDVRRERAPADTRRTSRETAGERANVAPIQVQTTRFGLLEAQADLALTFADGLIGFERCRRYIVVQHQDNSAFRWLQSLDEPHVAFPIVEPNEFCARYAPTVTDGDARALGLSADTPVLLFAIVTVPAHDPHAMTANLLGPLVINGVTRQGRQVIVQDEGYTTRHKIVDELARRAQAGANSEAVLASVNARLPKNRAA